MPSEAVVEDFYTVIDYLPLTRHMQRLLEEWRNADNRVRGAMAGNPECGAIGLAIDDVNLSARKLAVVIDEAERLSRGNRPKPGAVTNQSGWHSATSARLR